MKMYAIANKYEEDFILNAETGDFEMGINEKCLFPTKEVAKAFDMFNHGTVIWVKIESISANGIWTYSHEDIWSHDWQENNDEE